MVPMGHRGRTVSDLAAGTQPRNAQSVPRHAIRTPPPACMISWEVIETLQAGPSRSGGRLLEEAHAQASALEHRSAERPDRALIRKAAGKQAALCRELERERARAAGTEGNLVVRIDRYRLPYRTGKIDAGEMSLRPRDNSPPAGCSAPSRKGSGWRTRRDEQSLPSDTN